MIDKIINKINPSISDKQFKTIYESMIWLTIIGLVIVMGSALIHGHWVLSAGLLVSTLPQILNMVNVYMIFAPEDEVS